MGHVVDNRTKKGRDRSQREGDVAQKSLTYEIRTCVNREVICDLQLLFNSLSRTKGVLLRHNRG